MQSEPQQEHKWLQRLVGEWTYEHECSMGPDQPPMKATGTESVRSIGGLWTLGEGHGEMPDGGPAVTIMTLGYDPQSKRFVGTFIGSMMTHLWIYNGTLDAAGKVLTLDTEGPDFSGGTRPGSLSGHHRIRRRQPPHALVAASRSGRQMAKVHDRTISA